jgi:hypothetical protein
MENNKKIILSEDNVKEIVADYLRNQGYAIKEEPKVSILKGKVQIAVNTEDSI